MSEILTYEDIKEVVKLGIAKDKNKLPLQMSILDGKSGIYGIYIDGVCVYIGKSTNLLARIMEHEVMILHPDKIDMNDMTNKKYKMLNDICCKYLCDMYIKPILVQIEYDSDELSMLESAYIKKYLPYFNIAIPNHNCSIDYYKEYSESIDDFAIWVYDHGACYVGGESWAELNGLNKKIRRLQQDKIH